MCVCVFTSSRYEIMFIAHLVWYFLFCKHGTSFGNRAKILQCTSSKREAAPRDMRQVMQATKPWLQCELFVLMWNNILILKFSWKFWYFIQFVRSCFYCQTWVVLRGMLSMFWPLCYNFGVWGQDQLFQASQATKLFLQNLGFLCAVKEEFGLTKCVFFPETDIAFGHMPSQKETDFPTIDFQWLCYFQGTS